MPPESPPGDPTAMEREIRKLRTINKVLMDRVERDMDLRGGNAYSLFQAAITLESKVGERTAELSSLTHRLMHEISERREAERLLTAAKAQAEQANLSKTRFLAAASHDLYQPLNAARLYLGALAEEVPEGRARELMSRIDAALDTVDDLLGALLDISRLDAGGWPMTLSSFALAPVLARIAAEYAPQARAAGLRLRLVPAEAVVRTDRLLFERVLRNLVSNAIRYTARGGVLIGCRRRGGRIRVEVVDSGIGIPNDKFGTIFEEFQQLGNDPRRQDKGLGLGLAIVARIARLLDLDLTLASRPGRGSRFAVSVPLGDAAAPLPPAGPAGTLAGRRVLVIDNEPAALEGMAALLRSWRCEVTEVASSGAALVALCDRPTPEVIVADYHLDDGESGPDAIAAVRAFCGAPAPALVLSADRSPALREALRGQGHHFLGKPAPPARLRALLTHLLREENAAEATATPG